METSEKVPLASGLIGCQAKSIHGQLEVSLINYDTLQIEIWREAYCGLSNVTFSISDTDLRDIIEILTEAQKKVETLGFSRVKLELALNHFPTTHPR